jgi:hypothetical protein
MGSIKLYIKTIVNKVKQIISKSTQIINSIFNNIMTLITLACNSTTSKYEGDDRPRVSVTKDDIEQSVLCDTGAQQSCVPFKAFKRIYGPAKQKNNVKKAAHQRPRRQISRVQRYLVPMQILSRKVMHNLVVLEHVQDNIL